MTAIVTAKSDSRSPTAVHYGFLQFMVDCVARLERRPEDRFSVRTLQITKYRGSGSAPAAAFSADPAYLLLVVTLP